MNKGIYVRTEETRRKIINVCKKMGENNKGKVMLKQTRKKISKAMIGRKLSEEHKQNIHRARMGIKLSEETRKRISNALIGRKLSEKHKKNMKGRKLSEETKRKISKAKMGIKCSEETRRKISMARKGQRPPTLGHKCSEETRRKISEALKGEKSPFYRDGKGHEPYGIGFTETLKEKIRQRDDRTCQWPGCGVLENGRHHPVHHIDHNRHNNKDWNLITLCQKHNGKESFIDLDESINICEDVLRVRGILK